MPLRSSVATLLAALFLDSAAGAATVRVCPDTVWAEHGRGRRHVACDFEFTHEGGDTLELAHVEVSALDDRGRLLSRRFLGANGTAPSILTVPARRVWRGHRLLVFNPFAVWEDDLPIATLRYEFQLEARARAETLGYEVRPRNYPQRAKLVFPLAGRVFVFDAHDELAHHRRLDTTFEPIDRLGIRHNSGRFAYDLSVVDSRGSMWRTDGATNADWWSWGVPVRAPAAGRVVEVYAERPDYEVGKTQLALDEIVADVTTLTGNSIVIDHGHGEHSLLAHLRKGSVTVKPGDLVKAGQPIGAIGYSGSVFTVHLHYELRRGAGIDVDGLPSRFEGVDRWIGGKRVPARDGWITTGDIVESR